MLLDRSPLTLAGPFDLHTLGAPLAFVLSQDQTLHEKSPQQQPKLLPGRSVSAPTEGRIIDDPQLPRQLRDPRAFS